MTSVLHPTLNIFTVLHMLGIVAILAGYLMERAGRKGLLLLVWGARVQLATGIPLVWLVDVAGRDLTHMKLGIKLIVAVTVVGCGEMANAKAKEGDPRPALVTAAAGLTGLNILVAVLM